MRWVEAVEAVLAALRADAGLSAIPGLQIYRHGEHAKLRIPGIAWIVVSDVDDENTNPIRVQLDIFARGIDQALAIEGRLRALLQRDVPHTVSGMLMWTQLLESRDRADPEPGVIHRSLDFNLEPARGAYR